MTDTDLARLTERATAFARCYTALTEALIREGVPEDTARHEARNAAVMVILMPDEPGRPWPE